MKKDTTFDRIIISLRILLKKLATIIENVEDEWIFYDIIMEHKHILDQHIDFLIKEKRKYKKHYLRLLAIH
jgi:ParB family transcriptional regulator, chromosome partitioning protein